MPDQKPNNAPDDRSDRTEVGEPAVALQELAGQTPTGDAASVTAGTAGGETADADAAAQAEAANMAAAAEPTPDHPTSA